MVRSESERSSSMLVREFYRDCHRRIGARVFFTCMPALHLIGYSAKARAQEVGTEPIPPGSELIPAMLPRDLTPWGMFVSADIVVKAVLIGLVFASLVTWTIWL